VKLHTWLDTLTEKVVSRLPMVQPFLLEWNRVTQRLFTGIINCLGDILLDMTGKRGRLNGGHVFVGESFLKEHTWLSKHYSLFCARKSVKRSYVSNSMIRRILEKEWQLITKLKNLKS
jgi:hypothetical protein